MVEIVHMIQVIIKHLLRASILIVGQKQSDDLVRIR